MTKAFNKTLVAGLQDACRAAGSASAEIARCALLILAKESDPAEASKDVAMLMRDAVADIPGRSMGVYISQMRRVALAGTDTVRRIVKEREACGTWIGFESIIKAYEIPGTGSARGAKKNPPKEEQKDLDRVNALETLPGLLMAFTAMRAAAPKVSSNMEALTLMDQALALLRQEAQRAAQAAKGDKA